MASPYSQDLRDRVLAAYDRGMQTKVIASIFGVCPAWARRVKQVRREEGRTTPLPMGGARVVKIDLKELEKLVAQQPDATIPELHQRIGGSLRCSLSAVGMALGRLGLSFKKNAACRRAGPARRRRRAHGVAGGPSVAAAEQADLH